MLSHGGSRLNASKPEANPKTSCPNKKQQQGFAVNALKYSNFLRTQLLSSDVSLKFFDLVVIPRLRNV